MFNQISWTLYFQIVGLVLIPYYLIIISKYYRFSIFSVLTGKRSTNQTISNSPFTTHSPSKNGIEKAMKEDTTDNHDKEDTLSFQSFVDEIQAFLLGAEKNSFDKEQIYSSLQFLLGKYRSLKPSQDKKAIKMLIAFECETKCSVRFSEKELDELWN
jgi:hypothetical protein